MMKRTMKAVGLLVALQMLGSLSGCAVQAEEEEAAQDEQDLRSLAAVYDMAATHARGPVMLAPSGRSYAIIKGPGADVGAPMHRLQAFEPNGSPSWTSAPFETSHLSLAAPFLDDDGNVYVVENWYRGGRMGEPLFDSQALQSYAADGTLRWRTVLYADRPRREHVGFYSGEHLQSFHAGTQNLYIGSGSGISVVGKDGVIRWARKGVMYANSVAVGAAGDVVFSAAFVGYAPPCFVERVGANGVDLWTTRGRNPNEGPNQCYHSLGIRPDGQVVSASSGQYAIADWSSPPAADAPSTALAVPSHYYNKFYNLSGGRALVLSDYANMTREGNTLFSIDARNNVQWSLPGVRVLATQGSRAAVALSDNRVCVLDAAGRRRACTALPGGGSASALSLSASELLISYSLPTYERRLMKVRLVR